VSWASSALLYGASGQFTLAQILRGDGPVVLVAGATALVNLQMLLYGAAMRPWWVEQPRWWRVVAAQLLVGPVFAVASSHHRAEPDPALRRAFYEGAGVTLWVAWLCLTGLGYGLADGLPSVPLAFVTPLVMLTLALRAVTDRATLTALVVAACASGVALNVPYDLGFVVAGLVGVTAGVVVDTRGPGAGRRSAAEPSS
jgi:predicted branched-subunit amino acid permease